MTCHFSNISRCLVEEALQVLSFFISLETSDSMQLKQGDPVQWCIDTGITLLQEAPVHLCDQNELSVGVR